MTPTSRIRALAAAGVLALSLTACADSYQEPTPLTPAAVNAEKEPVPLEGGAGGVPDGERARPSTSPSPETAADAPDAPAPGTVPGSAPTEAPKPLKPPVKGSTSKTPVGKAPKPAAPAPKPMTPKPPVTPGDPAKPSTPKPPVTPADPTKPTGPPPAPDGPGIGPGVPNPSPTGPPPAVPPLPPETDPTPPGPAPTEPSGPPPPPEGTPPPLPPWPPETNPTPPPGSEPISEPEHPATDAPEYEDDSLDVDACKAVTATRVSTVVGKSVTGAPGLKGQCFYTDGRDTETEGGVNVAIGYFGADSAYLANLLTLDKWESVTGVGEEAHFQDMGFYSTLIAEKGGYAVHLTMEGGTLAERKAALKTLGNDALNWVTAEQPMIPVAASSISDGESGNEESVPMGALVLGGMLLLGAAAKGGAYGFLKGLLAK